MAPVFAQGINDGWVQRDQEIQELNARRESEREQVLAERKKLILASAEERERRMSVLAGQLAQEGVLFAAADDAAGETSPGVRKSDNSAAAFYDQNCKSCHF